jgi:hypothetical protein
VGIQAQPAIDADAARAAIRTEFIAKFGAPDSKVTDDVLLAYIDEMVAANNGAPHTDKQIQKLRHLVQSALDMLKKITSNALAGLDEGSTGPSPADNAVGLYKDFKKFVQARMAGGSQSEDKQRILYLEAQISELQGYLQSNSIDRIRLIAKIQGRFLKDANGPEAMKGRRRAWVAKLGDVKKFEALLEDTRIKLGRARVAERMLFEQVERDKELLKRLHKQDDESVAAARDEALRKYKAQKKRAEDRDQMAKLRLNVAGDIQYDGNHNHPAAAAAPRPAKKRRNAFADDEAEEAKEGEEDDEMEDYA